MARSSNTPADSQTHNSSNPLSKKPPFLLCALSVCVRVSVCPRTQNLLGVLYLLLPARQASAASAASAARAPAPPHACLGGELAKALWHSSAGISAFVRYIPSPSPPKVQFGHALLSCRSKPL
jgi:hypothetical protein